MKKLQFICTLKADLVFNIKTATEGNQQTLDYIPGSAFLGVVAGKLYNNANFPALDVFHSGKVRFCDAHPLIKDSRSYRLPAWWHYPKGGRLEDGIYTPFFKSDDKKTQIKQSREKFAAFNGDITFIEYKSITRFAIKSAYNSEKRRSEDAKMFGYQSLVKGSVWCFEMLYEENLSLPINEIRSALIGEQAIGKSKSAEYGLVTIEEKAFNNYALEKPDEKYCMIYAESRLSFLDENEQPTFCPNISQFGVLNGKIDWSRSQIRTFQYAPFNGKRQTRDIERFGIEKGSVICIEKLDGFAIDKNQIDAGVGIYKSEGFGRILIDPAFLEADSLNRILYKKSSDYAQEPESYEGELNVDEQVIFNFLTNAGLVEAQERVVYKAVNDFVNHNSIYFSGEKFASQWGTIRTLSMQSLSKQELADKLYDNPNGYLVHGVAAEKWKERGRLAKLQAFINGLNHANVIKAVINLSSEMAKKCKKEDNQ